MQDKDVQTVIHGRVIKLAPGVRMGEINWYLACIIQAYQDVCSQHLVVGCITGALDEPKGILEKDHQDNRALDLRSRDFREPQLAKDEMAARLAFYSDRFIVKHVDVGFGPHFHVCWR